MEIGKFNRARVESVTPQGYYLELETGGRVLLPGNKHQFELEEGEILDVFVYMDSEDRPIATLDKPYAQAGEFAVLTVKEVNRIGAFLDWASSIRFWMACPRMLLRKSRKFWPFSSYSRSISTSGPQRYENMPRTSAKERMPSSIASSTSRME